MYSCLTISDSGGIIKLLVIKFVIGIFVLIEI